MIVLLMFANLSETRAPSLWSLSINHVIVCVCIFVLQTKDMEILGFPVLQGMKFFMVSFGGDDVDIMPLSFNKAFHGAFWRRWYFSCLQSSSKIHDPSLWSLSIYHAIVCVRVANEHIWRMWACLYHKGKVLSWHLLEEKTHRLCPSHSKKAHSQLKVHIGKLKQQHLHWISRQVHARGYSSCKIL